MPQQQLSADLEALGIAAQQQVHVNLAPPRLVEAALARGEGALTADGALVALTGKRTGRSPDDKFFVRRPDHESAARVAWGKVNHPIDAAVFERLLARVSAYLQEHELFVVDARAGADPRYCISIRVVTDMAWHALFARQLFLPPNETGIGNTSGRWTVVSAPRLLADPARDGTHSETAVMIDLERRIVLICGTQYAGEIKKSIFTIMNYVLPARGILPMHCSANIGPESDVALFFGLSGTGKTTLSADPERRLIGDDEHAWSDNGVFNIEGGCYAKCINLSRKGEPQIWDAIRFGAVVENVVVDPLTGQPDYADRSLTENTRVAYPLNHIAEAVLTGVGDHPRTILFLAADAFGVLPPIARLSSAQARYHFLSGYTAKTAGTEVGVSEPQATFSTCFGAPFLPLPAQIYAHMLSAKMEQHGVRVFLLNTGWTGGPAGVGRRINLGYTRAMVHAALSGALDNTPTWTDPVFGLQVPQHIAGIPDGVMEPRSSWHDPAAYDTQAGRLAQLFVENFRQFSDVDAETVAAGPHQARV
jgi:phosphoenolpyruvate carboxykinase (ATP)